MDESHGIDRNTIHRRGPLGKLRAVVCDVFAQCPVGDSRIPADLCRQCSQRRRNVSGQLSPRPIVAVDLGADGVDMDNGTRATSVPERRLEFDRVVTDGDHDIGCVEQPIAGLIVKQTDPFAKAIE